MSDGSPKTDARKYFLYTPLVQQIILLITLLKSGLKCCQVHEEIQNHSSYNYSKEKNHIVPKDNPFQAGINFHQLDCKTQKCFQTCYKEKIVSVQTYETFYIQLTKYLI